MVKTTISQIQGPGDEKRLLSYNENSIVKQQSQNVKNEFYTRSESGSGVFILIADAAPKRAQPSE